MLLKQSEISLLILKLLWRQFANRLDHAHVEKRVLEVCAWARQLLSERGWCQVQTTIELKHCEEVSLVLISRVKVFNFDGIQTLRDDFYVAEIVKDVLISYK